MTHPVHFRWIISLVVLAVMLTPNNPCALAQSGAASEQVQVPAAPALPHISGERPSSSEAAKGPFVSNKAPGVDAREIKIDGRPVRGAKDAKVTIVLFDDFQCPYAAFMYKTLFEEVKKDYADRVKIALRDASNRKIHLWAKHAAINADCLAALNDDAYWDFTDYVHAHQKEIEVDPLAVLDKLAIEQGQKYDLQIPPLQQCIQTQSDILFEASRIEAIRGLGIRDVPTLFINGEKMVGSQNVQPLREAIDRALRNADQSVTGPDASSPTGSSQHSSVNSSDKFRFGHPALTEIDAAKWASPVSRPPEIPASLAPVQPLPLSTRNK